MFPPSMFARSSRASPNGFSFPVVTISLADQTFDDLKNGKVNGQKAFMSGKLKVKGNSKLLETFLRAKRLRSDGNCYARHSHARYQARHRSQGMFFLKVTALTHFTDDFRETCTKNRVPKPSSKQFSSVVYSHSIVFSSYSHHNVSCLVPRI